MQTSEHGLQLLKQWEGFKPIMYKDAAGLPTIGVGHLLKQDELASGKININGVPVEYAAGLSDEQVTALLGQDLEPAENAVNSGAKVELSQNQFDALVSFTFNTGTQAFADSTLLKMLNQGNYDAVPDQLRRWVRAGGNVIQGLVNRRENEIKLWLGQI
jgi:lysozyme